MDWNTKASQAEPKNGPSHSGSYALPLLGARPPTTPVPLAKASPTALPLPGQSHVIPPPLKETDPAMACVPVFVAANPTATHRSLPGQDQRGYYSFDPDASDDPMKFPGTTNRGNKLLVGARTARRGRMPGWSNTLPTEFEQASARKRRRLNITDRLSLAPSSSVSKKAGDVPAEATLLPPPRNPIDLFTMPPYIKTFSIKDSYLPQLALSATGLIEAEAPLLHSLSRLCSVLRSDDLAWIPSDAATTPSRKGEAEKIILEAQARRAAKEKEAREKEAKERAEQEQEQGSGSGVGSPSLVVQAASPRPQNDDSDTIPLRPDSHSTSPALPSESAMMDLEGETAKDAQLNLGDLAQFKTLLDPQNALTALFVSPSSVPMPYRTQDPAFSGQWVSHTHITSPADQQSLLQFCLHELSRFLADVLEYQARLREVTDGILGVERRRKGLYHLLKAFANEYAKTEAAEKGPA